MMLLSGALLYQLLALLSLWRFFRPAPPLPDPRPQPGVTILKPLKGLEGSTRECLESFLRQDYPTYEVLWGVADPKDPVLPLLQELKQAHPQRQVEILICPPTSALNPKVSTLSQLAPRARYDLLVVTDSDVKVGSDFLSELAAALAEPGVGLVTCPYRAGPAETLGAKLEALSISADFIPSVAVARYVEGIRFALGAALALPQAVLNRIGGFAGLADFLADDYQLGWRVHQAGFQVRLLPYVVATHNPRMSFKDYFLHQLRWTRTYRVCRPLGYLAFGVTHALVFSLAACLAAGGAPYTLGLLGATLTLRGGLAYVSERFCLKGELPNAAFWLLPVKDLLSFSLWLLSFLGQQVTWKNSRFRLTRDGRMVPVEGR